MIEISRRIEEDLDKLPHQPGVYLMHNETDEIIYVGKAIDLFNRVHQYFQSSRGKTNKILKMVSQVEYFEYIVTDSEHEALILECNLIKEYHPKYNTMLLDDKGYPYIGITKNEEYPRLFYAHQKTIKEADYFGPYTSGLAARRTLELLRKLFLLRECHKHPEAGKKIGRVCLNYHMGLCSGPCQGNIPSEDYRKTIHSVRSFLEGNEKEVLRILKEKMEKASNELRFEDAMAIRDDWEAVQTIAAKQKVNDAMKAEDRDVIGIYSDDKDAVVSLFHFREGKVIGRESLHLSKPEDTGDEEAAESFIQQFYGGTPAGIPKEINLPFEIPGKEETEKFLTKIRGNSVRLSVPQRGEKKKMMDLANQNAKTVLLLDKEKILRQEKENREISEELSALLALSEISRIEAFDISNTNGFQSVGSMVVFENARPRKQDYRKFRIKTVSGPDDYASMEEVLTRRFVHASDDDQKFSRLPDLILMDGGKGQVHSALNVLEKLGLAIPVAGMVKDDRHNTRGLYYQNAELAMDSHSKVFHFITRVQDEAHRFAITYHKSLRNKGMISSSLDSLPGVGEARKKALMRAFKDIDGMKKASLEEIAALDAFNEKAAETVFEFLHKEN